MGRHSKPSNTKRAMLTGSAAAAIGIGSIGTAHADTNTDRWAAIIKCESGGNPTAQNPSSTASGLFQFIDSTWKAYGGSTTKAKYASVAEQYAVANRAYAAEGYGPWEASRSCWQSKMRSPKVGTNVGQDHTPVPAPKPVPKPKPDARTQTLPIPAPTDGPTRDYEVKPGDTLWDIAVPRGMTWQELYEKNRDTVEHPDLIYPGEQLDL